MAALALRPRQFNQCRRGQRGLVAAALREVFNTEDQQQARDRTWQVIARLEQIAPKVRRAARGPEKS